jgi:hypothetical protein
MKAQCPHSQEYVATGRFFRERVRCKACHQFHELVLSTYACRLCGAETTPSDFLTVMEFVDGPDPGPHWVPHPGKGGRVSYSHEGVVVTYEVREVGGVLKGCFVESMTFEELRERHPPPDPPSPALRRILTGETEPFSLN